LSGGIEGDAEGMVEAGGELLDLAALPSAPTPRRMKMVPAPESARKRSPLGAVRMRRGMVKVPLLRAMCSLLSARCMGAESPPA
jgi:hypothetical protein